MTISEIKNIAHRNGLQVNHDGNTLSVKLKDQTWATWKADSDLHTAEFVDLFDYVTCVRKKGYDTEFAALYRMQYL